MSERYVVEMFGAGDWGVRDTEEREDWRGPYLLHRDAQALADALNGQPQWYTAVTCPFHNCYLTATHHHGGLLPRAEAP